MRPERAGCNIRLMIAALIAFAAIFSYFSSTQVNPTTGEKQRVNLNAQEEIALGLQAAPQMVEQYGGLASDRGQDLVNRIGNRVVQRSDAAKSPYKFEFHLLNDTQTVNAFALPGGQVFVTAALAKRLKSEAELAGVLGHEVGHVIARHGAEHLAKQQLTQGIVGAVGVASDSQQTAALAQAIGQLVNMKYGRNDEIESDVLGVKFLSQAGYDPRAMLGVMEVLASLSKGGRSPEFFSTHPNPENRIPRIKEAIQQLYPNGVPDGLER